ncbi:hypothetical protein SLPHG_CDS0023 [Salmonella phage Sephi301i]
MDRKANDNRGNRNPQPLRRVIYEIHFAFQRKSFSPW